MFCDRLVCCSVSRDGAQLYLKSEVSAYCSLEGLSPSCSGTLFWKDLSGLRVR